MRYCICSFVHRLLRWLSDLEVDAVGIKWIPTLIKCIIGFPGHVYKLVIFDWNGAGDPVRTRI